MKRKLFSILCLMLAIVPCLTLVACKKEESETLDGLFRVTSVSVTVAGETTTTTVEEYDELVAKEDKTMDDEMQLMIVETFFQMSWYFAEDKTFIQSFDYYENGDEEIWGSYSLKGENLSITCEGETINCKYADGKITMTMPDESMTISVMFE